ncbi:sel1 repeat family protein [Alphaproteobacteria bacterium]|nr:sel1 repeat family protein [Alphaproteobacteria bacterium]
MRTFLLLSLLGGGLLSVGGLAAYQFLAPQAYSEEDFAKGLVAFEAKNHEGAFEIWHPMAKAGHGRAQINIGQMYRTGQGVGKDRTQAQHWLGEAANAGLPRAQFALAETYSKTPIAEDKDPSQAAQWYRRAADQGHLGAMFWLAVATFNGQGIEQNYTEAYRLMLIASRHGHKDAERLLAQVQDKVDILDRIDAEIAAAKWIPKPENS